MKKNRPPDFLIKARIDLHIDQMKRHMNNMQLANSWEGENINRESLNRFYIHEAVAKDLCWVLGVKLGNYIKKETNKLR
jgi:hypothetical protein